MCDCDVSDAINLTLDEAGLSDEPFFIDGISIECRPLTPISTRYRLAQPDTGLLLRYGRVRCLSITAGRIARSRRVGPIRSPARFCRVAYTNTRTIASTLGSYTVIGEAGPLNNSESMDWVI